MDKNKNVTMTDIKGIIVVNMFRKKLTQKLNRMLQEVNNDTRKTPEKLQFAFDKMSGVCAVANCLDIISDIEYQSACQILVELLTTDSGNEISFEKVEEHYCKDYGFAETNVVFKINLQERLNDNFARFTTAGSVLSMFSIEDLLAANTLILEFGREFEILKKEEFEKGMDMLRNYKKGNYTPDKIIFIPEEFYTRLEGAKNE